MYLLVAYFCRRECCEYKQKLKEFGYIGQFTPIETSIGEYVIILLDAMPEK